MHENSDPSRFFAPKRDLLRKKFEAMVQYMVSSEKLSEFLVVQVLSLPRLKIGCRRSTLSCLCSLLLAVIVFAISLRILSSLFDLSVTVGVQVEYYPLLLLCCLV